MESETEKPFQLIAGNVVLDLVNTLDDRFGENGPVDLLTSYDDLLRFLVQSEVLTAEGAAKLKHFDRSGAGRILRRVKELRDLVSDVAYSLLDGKPIPGAVLVTLQRLFRHAENARVLRKAGGRLVWSWKETAGVAIPLWLLSQEAERLLLSDRMALLRSCGNPTCRWLFLDTSKNHSRRWCDMKLCGNRMKARRFHARQIDL